MNIYSFPFLCVCVCVLHMNISQDLVIYSKYFANANGFVHSGWYTIYVYAVRICLVNCFARHSIENSWTKTRRNCHSIESQMMRRWTKTRAVALESTTLENRKFACTWIMFDWCQLFSSQTSVIFAVILKNDKKLMLAKNKTRQPCAHRTNQFDVSDLF